MDPPRLPTIVQIQAGPCCQHPMTNHPSCLQSLAGLVAANQRLQVAGMNGSVLVAVENDRRDSDGGHGAALSGQAIPL